MLFFHKHTHARSRWPTLSAPTRDTKKKMSSHAKKIHAKKKVGQTCVLQDACEHGSACVCGVGHMHAREQACAHMHTIHMHTCTNAQGNSRQNLQTFLHILLSTSTLLRLPGGRCAPLCGCGGVGVWEWGCGCGCGCGGVCVCVCV